MNFQANKIIESTHNLSWLIILVFFILTSILIYPLIYKTPIQQASPDPPSKSHKLQKDLDSRFINPIFYTSFIAESKSKDILTQNSLFELFKATEKLKSLDKTGELKLLKNSTKEPYLYTYYDQNINTQIYGVYTIANAVENYLQQNNTSLENATESQVKIAIHDILNNAQSTFLFESLSINSTNEIRVIDNREIQYWTSPTVIFSVISDNKKLGGGPLSIGLGGGDRILNKEKFSRRIQNVLRENNQTNSIWGLALDTNLESTDQGQTAGIFIMLTVIGALLTIAFLLKSYWAVVLTGAGLGFLIIWLKGISNLIGLKSGLVIDLIVTISMISLGVDFAIHAIRRYQEESENGLSPQNAHIIATSSIFGALLLAMLSDSIAFLSNLPSNIEAVVHFGTAAAIAVIGSYIILGGLVPLLLMKIENIENQSLITNTRIFKLIKSFGLIGSTTMSAAGILVLVALDEKIGLIMLISSILLFVVFPFILIAKNRTNNVVNILEPSSDKTSINYIGKLLKLTTNLYLKPRVPKILLILSIIFTIFASFMAFNLKPVFDVKDFFSSNSSYVIGLDKLDEHYGSRAGEPGVIYLKGDLTNPDSLIAIKKFEKSLENDDSVSKDSNGRSTVEPNILDFLKLIVNNPYIKNEILNIYNIEITDLDSNEIPDTKKQIHTILEYINKNGIPLNDSTLIFNSDRIKENVYYDPNINSEVVTFLIIRIPGSREQSSIDKAYESITSKLNSLDDSGYFTEIGLTGSPFTRKAQLDASTDTLRTSLPIAVTATFILLLITMKSFRYAFATIIPIILVVTWLYGLMYLLGFSLNFVTAMIGAISIGIGIDYSIHITERFRQELKSSNSKNIAIEKSITGTGLAVVASALSSIVGFIILGFAPMPLFSSYGLLTALMMFLSIIASLVVLPCLLFFITPPKK